LEKKDSKKLISLPEEIKKIEIEAILKSEPALSEQEAMSFEKAENVDFSEEDKKIRLTKLALEVDALKQELKIQADKHEVDVERLALANREEGYNIQERKKYAKRLFVTLLIWMIIILVFLALSALKIFELSDTVLIALITTTTLNFSGFFFAVVKYLFPEKK
jgi:hypothetical protein